MGLSGIPGWGWNWSSGRRSSTKRWYFVPQAGCWIVWCLRKVIIINIHKSIHKHVKEKTHRLVKLWWGYSSWSSWNLATPGVSASWWWYVVQCSKWLSYIIAKVKLTLCINQFCYQKVSTGKGIGWLTTQPQFQIISHDIWVLAAGIDYLVIFLLSAYVFVILIMAPVLRSLLGSE